MYEEKLWDIVCRNDSNEAIKLIESGLLNKEEINEGLIDCAYFCRLYGVNAGKVYPKDFSKRFEIFKALLKAGADIDYCTKRNFSGVDSGSSLYYAIQRGNAEFAIFLIESGAKLFYDSKEYGRINFIDIVGEGIDISVTHALIKAGASPNNKPNHRQL